MSLDKNLFTLLFTQHKDNPNVIDLVDPSEVVHYRKQRVPGTPGVEYKIEVYEPSSESLLATVTAANGAAKTKTIELYNPTSQIELKSTGSMMSFRWTFKWEEHEFEWKKEECFIVRKPDPPVNIAVTREATKLSPRSVQLLDYNLNRFDINDRKGLEIIMLTALLTFGDLGPSNVAPLPNVATAGPATTSEHIATPVAPTPANPLSRAVSAISPSSSSGVGFGFMRGNANEAPPPPPPRPAPKTGIDRIAELQAMKGEYNEIIVSDEGEINDYAAYCNNLLQDDAMLFISVKSAEAEQVPKVLQVVEETKRIRYKAGLDEDQELHQYVLYDQKEPKKGPRIINLDDDKKNKYAPPKNLTIHLSKIDMPELQPKSTQTEKDRANSTKKKDDKKESMPSRPAPSLPAASPHASTSTSKYPTESSTPPKPAKTSRLDFFRLSSSSSSAPSKPNKNSNGKLQRPKSADDTPKPSPAPSGPQIPATKPDYRPPPSQAPATKPPTIPAVKPDYRPPQTTPQAHQSHHHKTPSTNPGRPTSYYDPSNGHGGGHGASSGTAYPQSYSWSSPPAQASGSGPTPPQSFYGSQAPYHGGSSWQSHSNSNPGSQYSSHPPPPPPSFPTPSIPNFSGPHQDYSGGGPKQNDNFSTIAQGASTMAQGFMGLIGGKK